MEELSIDYIENLVFEGKLIKEIVSISNKTESVIKRIIDGLINTESGYYDVARYKRLKKKINENKYKYRQFKKVVANDNAHIKNLPINKFVLEFAYGEISFLEAATSSSTGPLFFVKYLNNISDEEIRNRVLPILEELGLLPDKTKASFLLSLPIKVQKEIILMGSNLSCIFKITC